MEMLPTTYILVSYVHDRSISRTQAEERVSSTYGWLFCDDTSERFSSIQGIHLCNQRTDTEMPAFDA